MMGRSLTSEMVILASRFFFNTIFVLSGSRTSNPQATVTVIDDVNKARLYIYTGFSGPHSGDWLNAMPISSCGLRMDDGTIRVSIGAQIGSKPMPSTIHTPALTVAPWIPWGSMDFLVGNTTF